RGALAWHPGRTHTLAYVSGGEVVLRDVDSRRVVWRRRVDVAPFALAWSGDGRRLAVVGRRGIQILDGAGHPRRRLTPTGRVGGAAFEPGTHGLAVDLRLPRGSEVRLLGVEGRSSRVLFAGAGAFGDIAWSPNGRWLLVDWRTANQWLFLRGARVRAVANIAEQFPRPDDGQPQLR